MSAADRRASFRALHERAGIFVMPNAWDIPSARLFAAHGAQAIATTSAGFAWTLGKLDQQVTRDELLAHVETLAEATPLPLSVDSERMYAGTAEEIAETVRLLAEAGAAGCSIEDYDPASGSIDDLAVATERVGAAAEAARAAGLVLTARAERFLYGGTAADLDEVLERLRSYRAAGADVVYAPGLIEAGHIKAAVDAVSGAPVNVLALADGPNVPQLEGLGVRRVSTGSLAASAAYRAALSGVRELLARGTSEYARRILSLDEKRAVAVGGA